MVSLLSFPEAVERACQEPTLLDALTWVALWETTRIVAQAVRNERDPRTGALYDTCFTWYFEQILARYEKVAPVETSGG